MNNCAIIGSRRFGKTCVLQQLKFRLRSDERIFPVLVDARNVGSPNKNTSEVYRFLVSLIIEELYNAGIFVQTETIGLSKVITPCSEWEDNYQQILHYKDVEILSLFKGVVKRFAERMNKTILLMIDEYESLLTKSMEPDGFNIIRTLTQEPINNKTLMPLKYLICGAKNWEVFQEEIGSGVLNQTGITVYLPPISEQSFKDMWRNEMKKKDVSAENKIILDKEMDWAYRMSGGVPFYGKIIGNYICRENSCPDFSILRSFFWELVKNQFNSSQLSALLKISKDEKRQNRTDNIIELENEGVISSDNDEEYTINIKFLEAFLKANYDDAKSLLTKSNNDVDEYTRLVDEIFTTIKFINNTRKSKGFGCVFHPTDSDDTQTYMKAVCSSNTSFELFIKHVYITYVERTSNYSGGERIDGTYGCSLGNFKTSNQFFYAIGTLRHMHIHSDFKERKNQMSIPDVLDFFSIKAMPVSSEGYAILQLNVLRKMDEVLKELLTYAQNNEKL